MPESNVDYEHYPPGMDMDEADVSLRAHFARMSDAKLAEYNPAWTDEQLMEWEPNFRSDGNLMLVCIERDIDTDEYRQVIEQHIAYRRQIGAKS